METTTQRKAQITSLLPNDILARVEKLRLSPMRRFTNRSRGEHLSRAAGSSIEFKDYRDYVAGDDMRFVDWNIFSRLRKPYIKLYHEEEEKHVVILIDASSSMEFEGKLDRAKSLAAAFGVMGLIGGEKVSVYTFNSKDTKRIDRLRPHAGRGSMRQLFNFIEPIKADGNAPLDFGVDLMLKEHRGRGAAIVLSDFLTPSDLRRTFNLLFSAGLETFGMQILGPTEIEPDVSSDLRLIDSETGETLDISAGGDIVALYEEYRLGYQRHLEAMCQSRSGRLMTLNAGEDLGHHLFDVLRRRGWIR